MWRGPGQLPSRLPETRGMEKMHESNVMRREKRVLGIFEYALLESVKTLGPDAYGAEIGRFLSDKLGRDVTAPQVYITLERLKKQGFVSFENTAPVSAKGGRSRKRFVIEADGERALRETTAAFASSSSERAEYGRSKNAVPA
jgi:PadR family transcriptional regulator, regulatory protein PadR